MKLLCKEFSCRQNIYIFKYIYILWNAYILYESVCVYINTVYIVSYIEYRYEYVVSYEIIYIIS